MPRPRLMFLSQCLPYPPHSGVTNRTYHVLRQLQSGFDVTLVAFSRRNHQADAAARDAARRALAAELTAVGEPATIASEESGLSKALCHVRSLLTARPYTYYDYGSAGFGRLLRDELRARPPDIVHMDSLDLHRWTARLPEDCPVACTHHSIESELLRLRADRIRPRALARYMSLQAGWIEKTEKALCPRFALNVMMSDLDGERLRALAPGSRTLTVANGVDTEYFQPQGAEGEVAGRVVFLGPTYMFPNQDGVDFFLSEMWPSVRRDVPNATLRLIGKNPPDHKARYEAHAGVLCQGYVPDIRPHMAEAACSIVPLRVGGGTRLKILDAWALGRAVVSTSLGAEGLDIHDGDNILIRDDPKGFAEAVARVIGDRDLRLRLERNARRTAVESYGWDRIGETLRGAYHGLLRVPATG